MCTADSRSIGAGMGPTLESGAGARESEETPPQLPVKRVRFDESAAYAEKSKRARASSDGQRGVSNASPIKACWRMELVLSYTQAKHDGHSLLSLPCEVRLLTSLEHMTSVTHSQRGLR